MTSHHPLLNSFFYAASCFLIAAGLSSSMAHAHRQSRPWARSCVRCLRLSWVFGGAVGHRRAVLSALPACAPAARAAVRDRGRGRGDRAHAAASALPTARGVPSRITFRRLLMILEDAMKFPFGGTPTPRRIDH